METDLLANLQIIFLAFLTRMLFHLQDLQSSLIICFALITVCNNFEQQQVN